MGLTAGVNNRDIEYNGAAVSEANPIPVSVQNAELNVDIQVGEVITVTGGPGQTADVKVTLDGEAVVLALAISNGAEADQALTVDATVGGVQLAALHADTTQVMWDCQVAPLRVTFDGSAPTSANGHLIMPGDCGVWSKALAAAAKFIRSGATSAVLHVSQLKGA